jgi:hypothetical protein
MAGWAAAGFSGGLAGTVGASRANALAVMHAAREKDRNLDFFIQSPFLNLSTSVF